MIKEDDQSTTRSSAKPSHKRSLAKILKSRKKATKLSLQSFVILVYESTRAGAFGNNLPILNLPNAISHEKKQKPLSANRKKSLSLG